MAKVRDYLFLPELDGAPRRPAAPCSGTGGAAGASSSTVDDARLNLTGDVASSFEIIDRALQLLDSVDPATLDAAALRRALGPACPPFTALWIDAVDGTSDKGRWLRQLTLLLEHELRRGAPAVEPAWAQRPPSVPF